MSVLFSYLFKLVSACLSLSYQLVLGTGGSQKKKSPRGLTVDVDSNDSPGAARMHSIG